jgi:hypothetical protein
MLFTDVEVGDPVEAEVLGGAARLTPFAIQDLASFA